MVLERLRHSRLTELIHVPDFKLSLLFLDCELEICQFSRAFFNLARAVQKLVLLERGLELLTLLVLHMPQILTVLVGVGVYQFIVVGETFLYSRVLMLSF